MKPLLPHRAESKREAIASSDGLPAIALALLTLSNSASLSAEAPIHSISTTPQRDYGIVIGETVSAEIRVAIAPGFALETAALPQPGNAVDDFLALRESSWSQQSSSTETVYRLKLVYQVFKGVRDMETLTVPALPLRFNQGDQTVEAQAPAWNFTLTPLIPGNTADENVVLRDDLPAPTPADKGHQRWFLTCLAGLAILVIYAVWHLGLLRRPIPPFILAVRLLKKLRRQTPSLETWRQGARLVHTALNATAGYTLLSGQLPYFLTSQPCYAGLQSELEQFFQFSDRLFFTDTAEYPTDYPIPRLETLCRKLAAAGKSR